MYTIVHHNLLPLLGKSFFEKRRVDLVEEVVRRRLLPLILFLDEHGVRVLRNLQSLKCKQFEAVRLSMRHGE